ncbi:MAG: hypothetical protein H0T74_01630 [Rubrobacteraceae bacterium]|nr:hypothetical protein [Rubrobacteraceae bacterium]
MDGTSHRALWRDEAERFIERYGLAEDLSIERLQELLFSRTASWTTTLPDGSGFHFLKLRVPVVEREEVLTGNLLFGDFVRKCALEGLNQNGEAIALTGDLDDAYYLAVSRKGVGELALAVRVCVEARLPELFLAGKTWSAGSTGTRRTCSGSPNATSSLTLCSLFRPSSLRAFTNPSSRY